MLTYFFKLVPGDKYWVFREVTAEPGYPHSLVELGSSLPKSGIDTALRWEPVGKTYFFKGDQYWRYNEEKHTTDAGYPKPITVWKGIPDAPQGAFISREGCEWQLIILLVSGVRRDPVKSEAFSSEVSFIDLSVASCTTATLELRYFKTREKTVVSV